MDPLRKVCITHLFIVNFSSELSDGCGRGGGGAAHKGHRSRRLGGVGGGSVTAELHRHLVFRVRTMPARASRRSPAELYGRAGS